MDKYERDLMKIFCCSPEWPICLFDFTQKNRNPTYLSLRVKRNLTEYLIADYFFTYLDENSKKVLERRSETSRDDMLIERNQHMCTNK